MSEKEKTKVLFLGNSHTYYNDMPLLFKEIAEERGKNVEIRMIAQSGVTYEWHLNHYIELRFELMYGNYDYIVMQQAAHGGPPTKEETLRDAHKICALARKFGTTPIQTIPWAEKKYPEHQAEMYDIFESVSSAEGIRLNPVGRIFDDLRHSHPEINLFWIDGEHASPYGTYINALSAYAVIFGESVRNVKIEHSRNTYPISQENWDAIDAAYALAYANPENKELMKKADSMWDELCPAVTDPAEALVTLDPEKAAIIRETVEKYALPR